MEVIKIINKLINKKLWLIVLIVSILALAGCSNNNDNNSKNTESKAQKLIDYQNSKYDSVPASGKLVNGVREIQIIGQQYFWEPNEVIVNQGDSVRLIVKSLDVPHGFEIEGFNIPGYEYEIIEKGKPIIIEFDANEKGSWEFLCAIYCGPGHGSMKGKFIIK